MKGNIPLKIVRLVANLARNPKYIPRCFSHNVINGRTPLDLEIPWFSYGAIDFLDRCLRPGMEVFEYGSGGSTLFFAKRAKSVSSVEDNITWYELVTARVRQQKLTNVMLKLCPFDFKRAEGFEESDYLNAIPDSPFDVIVVDGSEEWVQVRPTCFKKAEQRVKAGGMIVLDDSWRYPEVRKNHRARKHEVFQSVGPCRPGVTSTDVFFY